jgi:hypothetical protein
MARLIAKAGWGKDELRQYLYDNCRISARLLERRGEVMNINLIDQVRKGVLPAVYHESDDPERLVPLFVRPEWIGIVVAGAPTTFFRGYMNKGLAQQRYVKSHRILANCLGVKDLRRFRNSQDGTWFSRSVLGA